MVFVMQRFLIMVLALGAASPLPAQKRTIVPEDLYLLRTASNATLSPDGRWVVYVQTSIDSVRNRYIRDLYAARTSGGGIRRLTYTPESSEGSPVFSPDGRQLAFVARREGDERGAEIYLLPFAEPGEARRVTTVAQGVSEPVFSPDGTRLAFTVNMPEDTMHADTVASRPKAPMSRADRLRANAKKNDPRVITRLDYVDEQTWQEDRWSQIYVVDLRSEGPKAEQITTGQYNHDNPAWTADGRSIIYAAAPPRANSHADFETDSDVFIVDAEGKNAPRNLTSGHGNYAEARPRASADGKRLAYVRRFNGAHRTAANNELVVANIDGSAPSCVSCVLDRSVTAFSWDERGRLFFALGDRGGVHLYRSSAKESRPVRIIGGARGALSFGVANNVVAWTDMQPMHPSDVYAADGDGKAERRLTALNDSLLAAVHVQPYEEMWYTARDGSRLQGWIVRPPAGASAKTPLAVEMHGGPHVMWGPGEASMWLEYQALAGDGYTVFFANPRGSEGYGFEHKKAIHRNWGELPMSDVLTGADSVIGRRLADARRQYITGGSYAGYLTAWIVGHTNRFKAAVAQRGVFDMTSWWGMANTWRLYESEFASVPWEDPKLAWEASPIAYAASIQTPLLLLHGQQDYRVGLGGVQTLFRMLKAQGKEVEMVLYPREGHEVTRSGEPNHRVDHMLRILDWFDAHQ